MIPYFADTFYYIALLNPRDEAHTPAVQLTSSLVRPILTTAWVLTEVADAFASPVQRRAVIGLFDDLRIDPQITILPPTADLFEQGYALFR